MESTQTVEVSTLAAKQLGVDCSTDYFAHGRSGKIFNEGKFAGMNLRYNFGMCCFYADIPCNEHDSRAIFGKHLIVREDGLLMITGFLITEKATA